MQHAGCRLLTSGVLRSGLGWGALLAAGLALLWIVGRLPSFLSGLVRSKEGGKWVRDRSLGGKMVRLTQQIPLRASTPSTASLCLLVAAGGSLAPCVLDRVAMVAVTQTQVFVPDIPSTVPQRDSVGTAEDVDLLRGSASAHVATSASEQGTNGDEMPDWWNPTPALHVSLYYKQEVCSSSPLLSPAHAHYCV